MSDNTDVVDAGITVQVWSTHRPRLPSGTYIVSVRQDIRSVVPPADKDIFTSDEGFRNSRKFVVGSSRLTLAPTDVHAVFPPDGSDDNYQNVAPHIVLSRSTLPWEHSASPTSADDNAPPWLALLVLTPDEFTVLHPADAAKLPGSGLAGLTPRSTDKDAVSVIDIKLDVLQKFAPTLNQLRLLTHVRAATHAQTDDRLAVVVSKRLPKQGAINIVHLVALNGCYPGDADQTLINPSSAIDGHVQLVSLYRWSFKSSEDSGSVTNRLSKLQDSAQPLHLPLLNSILDKAPLSDRRSGQANAHTWYRGPLLPLGRADGDHQANDLSYASARALGRLLLLESPGIAKTILLWRHSLAQAAHRASDSRTHYSTLAELPEPATDVTSSLPAEALQWLKNRTLLDGIPLHYLVPDEAMLPTESVRFFEVDPAWLRALVAGALQLDDLDLSTADADAWIGTLTSGQRSGLLIRSQLIRDWPGLAPEARDANGPLTTLRKLELSPNLLLCLYDGLLTRVRIHKPPAMLHFEVPAGKIDVTHPATAPSSQIDGNRCIEDIDTSTTSSELAKRLLQGQPLQSSPAPKPTQRSP